MFQEAQVPTIMSTGGYNDQFMRFVANVFKTQIVKCHEFLRFVVHSIDYIDKFTNDCFYKLVSPINTYIAEVGKIDKHFKPK